MIKKDVRLLFICTKDHHVWYIENIIKNEFNIILDSKNPEYIIVGDGFIGYDNKAIYKFFSMYKNAITIFIALESILPDLNFFDYIIVRDNIKFDDRCIRSFYNQDINEKLCNGLSIDESKKILESKKYFCNFIYSHTGHPTRDLIFQKLQEYKKVDSLGRHLKNSDIPVGKPDGNFFTSSIEAKKYFKFSIAAENGIYKNGVTEKIYSSFLAHTIPIYFGDINIESYFNKDAFINYHRFSDINDLVDKVKEIDNNDKLYCEIISRPIITKEQYDNFRNEVLHSSEMVLSIFRRGVIESKRKPDAVYVNSYALKMKKRANRMNNIINIEKILLTIAWLIPIKVLRDRFKRRFL